MPTERSYTELELMQARVEFVPDGWRFCCIREAFVICNNLRRPISEEERAKNSGPYPYFGPTKIQGYIGTYEQDGKYTLIGEDGDHFLKYRTQPMTQLVEGKCTVNNHAHIIEGSDIASREWFYHYFMHRDIFSFLSRQGAGRYKLNKASLEKIPVLIPPRLEQKKIAQILSTWDQAITATESLLENSQQRKKGLMQLLLTGKKRLPGFEGEFKAISLSAAATITMGTSPKSAAYNSIGDGLPLLQGNADIESRRSKPRVYTSEITKTCQPSDILLSVRAPVGSVAISNHEACIGRGICAIKAKNKNNQEFLYQWMLWYEPRWASLSQGSTFESVNSSDIKNLQIKLPEPGEQKAISSVLFVADRESELLGSRLNRLKQEKKALMQQLLTGKRRVNVDMEAA